MSRKTRYLFYLCGDRTKASSRVRGFWVAETLEESGVSCFLEYRDSKMALLSFLFRIMFYDVVVFQKTYSRWHRLLLVFANCLGKKTILDLDDAPSLTNHPVTLRNVETMMRNVSVVSVGSKALYDYASEYSQNVHLIPSCINLKYYNPIEKPNVVDGEVCVGWIGNGGHYKKDLISILKEPLTHVAKKSPLRFKLIGACGETELYDVFGAIPGLQIDFIDQIDWGNPEAVSESLHDVDIGLYPLLPNQFNQYKCGFKALEYMAIGVPVVSSPISGNVDIICDGEDGFLVNSKEEWIETLNVLLSDPVKRTRIGKLGREKVEGCYSVAKVAELLESIVVSV